jgi:hypothetical protein
MKNNSLILVAIAFASLSLNSCGIKGCTDDTAKNYDADAIKDDESCVYYSEFDHLTAGKWNFKSVSSANSLFDSALTVVSSTAGSYMKLNTDQTSEWLLPSANLVSIGYGTWEFNDVVSELTLIEIDLAGLNNPDTTVMSVKSVDLTTLVTTFMEDINNDSTLSEVELTFDHLE